jgi:glycine oxidase
VLVEKDRVSGVRTLSGDFNSPIVINSAGSWASEIGGVERVEIRPIKGQMLLLDCGKNEKEIPRHTIYAHNAYLVPRADGRLIVGTTVEDKGFDKEIEQEAVEGLHQSAAGLFPFLGEMTVVEAWAGLRPLGEQDIPTIGPLSPEGYYTAVGHYRNGILLTPLTQELLARKILDGTA